MAVGDELLFQNWETGEQFATAIIIEVHEKDLGQLKASDFDGHEKFENENDMLSHYREYYGDRVNLQTIVKIIKFKLVD